jgi:uncharacterized integral membrane protein
LTRQRLRVGLGWHKGKFQKERREAMGSYIKGIILAFILLFLTTFGVRNNQMVQINYYTDKLTYEIPLYGLVYISLILGFLGGIFFGLSKRFSQMRTLRALHKENKELKAKIPEEPKERAVSEAMPAEKPEPTEAEKKEEDRTLVISAEKTDSE